MRNYQEYTILDDIAIITGAFTAAVTDICTDAAHGLKDGDRVVLTTTDTLPAGLATATVYWVKVINANTFYLCNNSAVDGVKVDITDTGTGTHTWTMNDVGNSIFCADFEHAIFIFATDGGGDAALTVKFQGSYAEDCPDFSAATSVTNQWEYIQVVDLENSAGIDGDTGVAVAGADDYRQLEANVNAMRWVNAIISGYTVGEITIKVRLYTND